MKKSLICLVLLSLMILGFQTQVDADEKDEYRRELTQSKQRELGQKSLVAETKIGEFHTDKSIIDVHGVRVRIEQYVLRPESNQYKIVVYNTRDTRSDTGYSLRTFNKDLPEELSFLLTYPTLDTGEPEYYKTDEENRVSNGSDYVEYLSENGHLYKDQNENYFVLYRHEKTTVNDNGKIESTREGSGIDSLGIVTWKVPNETGTLEKVAVHDVDRGTWSEINWGIIPDLEGKVWGQDAHYTWQWDFVDETFFSGEDVWINDDGDILTRAQLHGEGLTADTWKDEIVKWNQELIYKATEFEGRYIDLVWSPHSLWLQAHNEISGD